MFTLLYQGLFRIGSQPSPAGSIDVILIAKGFILILALIHIILAFRVLLQMRRLQTWLPLLKGYRFDILALIHLGLAVLGFFLILVAL